MIEPENTQVTSEDTPGSAPEAESESGEPEESTAPEGQKQEALPPQPDLLTPFVEYLSETCSEEDRFTKLRATPSGLFISESYLAKILVSYAQWFSTSQGANLPEEKLQRKLLGNSEPNLSYLLDGKTTLIGYLAPYLAGGTLSPSKKIKIPFFQGSLIDAADYLHMRDPIFTNCEGIEAHVESGGFHIRCSGAAGQILLTQESLKQFALILKASPFLIKKFPAVKLALRNALPAFHQVWRNASVASAKYKTFVPPAFRKENFSQIYKSGEIILIQDQDKKLAFTYGMKGKNFRTLVARELTKLSRGGKNVRFKNARILKQKGMLLQVEARNDSIRVPERIAKEFVEHAAQIDDIREKLPQRFTAKDALDTLTGLLVESAWIEEHSVPRQFIKPGHTYRKKDAFIFTLGRNFTVEKIHHPALQIREKSQFDPQKKSSPRRK